MQIVTEPDQLAEYHGGVLVPTMGSLHEGHLSLIRIAAHAGAPVVTTVFVNPTQFGRDDDFDRYPRTLESDAAAASAAGADIVFAPSVDSVYPPDGSVSVPPLPAVATDPGLEDACRPGHFEGVCQVVARFFDLTRPMRSVFGEKDYQQLLVIEAMVRAQRPRWGQLEIVRGPTIRDADGLALSSRNEYLEADDRDRALALSRALLAARETPAPDAAERSMRDILDAAGLVTDYAVIRDARTLMAVGAATEPRRGLVAARLGNVRLIDNMPMPPAVA